MPLLRGPGAQMVASQVTELSGCALTLQMRICTCAAVWFTRYNPRLPSTSKAFLSGEGGVQGEVASATPQRSTLSWVRSQSLR